MRKYKIILVENDEDEQLFMKEGFDAAGSFEILAQLKNGDTLMEWLEENQEVMPDVILSDLNMPGKNGYDIIREVKAHPLYHKVPVIITSTSSAKMIMDKCLALGASEYQVKPETFIEYAAYASNLYRLIEKKQLVK